MSANELPKTVNFIRFYANIATLNMLIGLWLASVCMALVKIFNKFINKLFFEFHTY